MRPRTPAPTEWVWHAFPAATLDSLGGARYHVVERPGGFIVRASPRFSHNLIAVRRAGDGFVAQAAGNSPVGMEVVFHDRAIESRIDVDRALAKLARSTGGQADGTAFLDALATVRRRLTVAHTAAGRSPGSRRVPHPDKASRAGPPDPGHRRP